MVAGTDRRTDIGVLRALEGTHRTTEGGGKRATVNLDLTDFSCLEDNVQEVVHAFRCPEGTVRCITIKRRNVLKHRHARLNRRVTLRLLFTLAAHQNRRKDLRIGLAVVSDEHRLVRHPHCGNFDRRSKERFALLQHTLGLETRTILAHRRNLRVVLESNNTDHVTAVVVNTKFGRSLTNDTRGRVLAGNRNELLACHFDGQHSVVDIVTNEVCFGCEHTGRRKHVRVAHDGDLCVTGDDTDRLAGRDVGTGKVCRPLLRTVLVDLGLYNKRLATLKRDRRRRVASRRRKVCSAFGGCRRLERYDRIVLVCDNDEHRRTLLVTGGRGAVAILVEVHRVVVLAPCFRRKVTGKFTVTHPCLIGHDGQRTVTLDEDTVTTTCLRLGAGRADAIHVSGRNVELVDLIGLELDRTIDTRSIVDGCNRPDAHLRLGLRRNEQHHRLRQRLFRR